MVRPDWNHQLSALADQELKSSLLATNLYSAEHLHLVGQAGSSISDSTGGHRTGGGGLGGDSRHFKWTPSIQASIIDQAKAGVHTFRVYAATLRKNFAN